jgi:hypothetical protein
MSEGDDLRYVYACSAVEEEGDELMSWITRGLELYNDGFLCTCVLITMPDEFGGCWNVRMGQGCNESIRVRMDAVVSVVERAEGMTNLA